MKNKLLNLETLLDGIFIILMILSIPFLIIGISRFLNLYIKYLNK